MAPTPDRENPAPPTQDVPRPIPLTPTGRLSRVVFGAPRDVHDADVFHKISLVAFLAWVGLGADGLSSSAYGPDEAFRALGEHAYLAVFLAVATAFTVVVISFAYSRVIEHFPHGGGGYVVATKLLGRNAGVVSGCALLVDYILTITISVAAGADAVFSLLPPGLAAGKVPVEIGTLLVLIVLNIRGVKESVTALMPIFLLFLATHALLIVGGILGHLGRFPDVVHQVGSGLHAGASSHGRWGLFLLFLRAYSLGGGTYTGIEAVSNGLQIMREPKVKTGKRTMLYMAASLAFTAAGIIVCYLLFDIRPVEGKTMNAVLAEAFAGHFTIAGVDLSHGFVVLTMASEGTLLLVAAQAGFIDGPRVMANMAVDSWLPHRFASLSDRLTTKDGIVLIGGAAIAVLVFTRGDVDALVVMYSINVFLTFSLTALGMSRFWWRSRGEGKSWKRDFSIQLTCLVLCLSILAVTLVEKFRQGGWLTLLLTSGTVALCVVIRVHYRSVQRQLRTLDKEFISLPSSDHHGGAPDPALPTAVLLVGSYGGIGIHALLSLQRMFPGYYKNVIFVSTAVIDSGAFKGAEAIAEQLRETEGALARYVSLAQRLGWNAASVSSSGIDPASELTRMCIALAKVYPRSVYFGGKLIWKTESWWQRILHNETSYQVQRRLQWKGLPMTVLPIRISVRR